ncbi:MAG TPA: metal-dependent transcriptional regulator [Methylomirabilota bacterium]|nr:metal-dependent transcriptional regulator [Methylomirabilota bacterium]
MLRDKTSASREDYLKAIWDLAHEQHEPISARLADELGVTPPAVTAALKRMTRDGLIRVERNGRILLTGKGRAQASRLALRHQLAEKLLTEVIGLDWTRAHVEAERLEHGISPEVERLLIRRFGTSGSCPHGVPLAGGLEHLLRAGAVSLADVSVPSKVEIVSVYEKDADFLKFLDGLRLRPGARVRVQRREYDETMTLQVGNSRVHLGKPATTRIWVRVAR